QHAYDVLSDENKRSQYDQFGEGFENMTQGPGGFGGGGSPFAGADLESLFGGGGGGGFEQFFNTGGPQGPRPTKGQSLEDKLKIPFATAVTGGKASVNTVAEDGNTTSVQVTIPAGIESGQKIRLKGKGYPGSNGGPNGDILLTINVAPHPDYRRNGNDLELTMPLTLAEALQGTELDIPTPYSTITLKIPAGTPSGKRFRVKQHGVTHKTGKGNLFVITQIHFPDEPPAELVEQIDALQQPNPRHQISW
ncbi:MAG: J domain-containing protein, partial [Pirellulaceae bacterium]|nr:J domain-containing protein [Pirellulaceae bacterium]